MKEKLTNLFYLPNMPLEYLIAIIYLIKEFRSKGVEVLLTGFDDNHLEKWLNNHYHPILQKIIALIGWFLIFKFIYQWIS